MGCVSPCANSSQYNNTFSLIFLDLQKLEREARVCRMMKHRNIGK